QQVPGKLHRGRCGEVSLTLERWPDHIATRGVDPTYDSVLVELDRQSVWIVRETPYERRDQQDLFEPDPKTAPFEARVRQIVPGDRADADLLDVLLRRRAQLF